jgi:HlyD family secretion protein
MDGDQSRPDARFNTLRGSVRLVEPAAYTKVTALGVEEQRVNVIVTLSEVPAVLGDGFAADAHIEVQRTNNVLKVPSGAAFRDGSAFAVFVVKGKRCKLVHVEVENRNADEVQITGLAKGAIIIVHPSDKLKDGGLVTSQRPR